MLQDVLSAAIKQRFPEIEFTSHSPHGAAIVIWAKHSEVGDISIWDDGDEATVELGGITHGHVADYTPHTSEDQAFRLISEAVILFLERLFADRVLFWKTASGGGGWRVLQDQEFPQVRSDPGTQYYLWSGPLE